MEVSVYLDAPAALPTGREPYITSQQQVWWVWTFGEEKKLIFFPVIETNFSVSRA
jgi:hypothetical protein